MQKERKTASLAANVNFSDIVGNDDNVPRTRLNNMNSNALKKYLNEK